jgi:hypothetical protein
METDSDEEDLSDETFLSRHDVVLQQMREKWALMNRLKQEIRRESSVTNGQRKCNILSLDGNLGDHSDNMKDLQYFPVQPTLMLEKWTMEGSMNSFYDSKVETPLLFKKRGRPPKHHKGKLQSHS